MRDDLLRWQWQGYPAFHRDRINLLVHIVCVPTLVIALGSFVFAICTLHWVGAGCAFATAFVAFALQGVGHKREAMAPIDFLGPLDALTRILAEQFITFPRFLFSGRLAAALRLP